MPTFLVNSLAHVTDYQNGGTASVSRIFKIQCSTRKTAHKWCEALALCDSVWDPDSYTSCHGSGVIKLSEGDAAALATMSPKLRTFLNIEPFELTKRHKSSYRILQRFVELNIPSYGHGEYTDDEGLQLDKLFKQWKEGRVTDARSLQKTLTKLRTKFGCVVTA